MNRSDNSAASSQIRHVVVASAYAHYLAQSPRCASVAASGFATSSRSRHKTVCLRATGPLPGRLRHAGRRPVVEDWPLGAQQTSSLQRTHQLPHSILRHQHCIPRCRSVRRFYPNVTSLVRPTQGVEPFGNISSPLCTLAISAKFYGHRPREPLRRGR